MAQLPDPLLNNLRCIRCKNFLSCGPVTILKDGYSLCGRCHIKDSNTFQAVAYEAVAEYFLFRCKNFVKHCAYLLNWNDVLQHEEECSFSGTCSIMCNNPGALFKSDNKLDLNQDMGVFKVPEQILQTLTCSACGYYLSSLPIFVNPEGRSTCHRCYAMKEHVPPDFVRHAALEKILNIMLFPCIYRPRGCTQFFRFGIDTTSHEKECAYAQTRKKQMRSFTDANGKKKGVIETHSGHMFGTITPNSQFFVAQEKIGPTGPISTNIEPLKVIPNKIQGAFFNELMDHRDHLVENKWRSSMNEPRTPEDLTPRMAVRSEPIMREPSLSRKESQRNDFWTPDTPTRRYFDENREPITRRESQRNNFDFPSNNMRPTLAHPPIQEDYSHDNDVDRRFQSYNSISESPNSPDSPRSSVNLNNFSYNPPLKLNAQDLAHSNSFSYLERFEKPMERTGSAASDRPTGLQYNGSFRN